MAIAVDARSNGAQGSAATVTWSHTVAGSDRILLVAASITGTTTATVSSVTFGAASFTQYATVNLTTVGNGLGGPMRVYLFRLIAPATGTDTITVNCSYGGTGYAMGSSISLTGVDQTTPFNAAGPHTQNTTNAQPSVVVTSAADEWCIAAFSAVSNPDPTPVAGAGQTTIGDRYQSPSNIFMQHLFTDEDAGGSPVTLDYTSVNTDPAWGIGGIGASLMPAGGAVTLAGSKVGQRSKFRGKF